MYASRLIWPESYPAPFESGWSILCRVLILNGLTPKILSNLIHKDGIYPSNPVGYPYSWIDFSKFGNLLSVDPIKLRRHFSMNWGCKFSIGWSRLHHKICPACLQNGYHTPLFNLGFIDTCPIHTLPLVRCDDCYNAVHSKGFLVKNISDDLGAFKSFSSPCKHVVFNENNISLIYGLTENDKGLMFENISLMLQWLDTLHKKYPLLHYKICNFYDPSTDEKLFESYLSASISIAGEFPWPIKKNHYQAKIITLFNYPINDNNKKLINTDYFARSSYQGKIYKCIYRYIYKTYVKSHKLCLNRLKKFDYVHLQKLEKNKICHMSLAFVIWRSINEGKLNPLDIFSKSQSRDFHALTIPADNLNYTSVTSNHLFGNLFFAQFFYILREISTNENFIVKRIKRHRNFVNYIHQLNSDIKISIIYPAPSRFNNFFQSCVLNTRNYSPSLIQRSSGLYNNIYSSSGYREHICQVFCKNKDPNDVVYLYL